MLSSKISIKTEFFFFFFLQNKNEDFSNYTVGVSVIDGESYF